MAHPVGVGRFVHEDQPATETEDLPEALDLCCRLRGPEDVDVHGECLVEWRSRSREAGQIGVLQ